MYCKNCGKEIADDSKFCQHCGAQTAESNGKRKLSKIDWCAILAGLIWIAYWASEAISLYSEELNNKWFYAAQLQKIHKETYNQSLIRSEVLGESVSYFINHCIIPLLVVIAIYIIVPVIYKKYKERKREKNELN